MRRNMYPMRNPFQLPSDVPKQMYRLIGNSRVPLSMQKVCVGDLLTRIDLSQKLFIIAFSEKVTNRIYVNERDQRLAVDKSDSNIVDPDYYASKDETHFVGLMSVQYGPIGDGGEISPCLLADLRYLDAPLFIKDYEGDRPDDEEEAAYYDECREDMVKIDGFITEPDVEQADGADTADCNFYAPEYLVPALQYLAYQMDRFNNKLLKIKLTDSTGSSVLSDNDLGTADDDGADGGDDMGDSDDGDDGRGGKKPVTA